MARLSRLPLTYYTVGPRPFSGHDLRYYDAYVLQLMAAVRALALQTGVPLNELPAFSRYRWTEDDNGLWRLFRAAMTNYSLGDAVNESGLVETGTTYPYVWSTERTYGVSELKGAVDDHHHGEPQYTPLEQWQWGEFAAGDLAGKGKSIVGNYIWDIWQELLALIEGQGWTWQTWTRDFKEIGESGLGEGDVEWHEFGFFPDDDARFSAAMPATPETRWNNRYNLTTDHVEALRIWPRSMVNLVDSNGNQLQLDARLEDRDSEGFPGNTGGVRVCKRAVDVWNDGASVPVNSNLVAVLEGSGEQTYVYADGFRWHDTSSGAGHVVSVATPIRDACIASDQFQTYLFLLHATGQVTVYTKLAGHGWTAGSTATPKQMVRGLRQYAGRSGWWPHPLASAASMDATGIEPLDADTVRYYGLQGDGDWSTGETAEEDADLFLAVTDAASGYVVLLAYAAGDRALGASGLGWQDALRVVGLRAVGWTPAGISREQAGGLPKEGPPFAWRFLVGERGRQVVRAVDLVSTICAEADIGADSGEVIGANVEVVPKTIFVRVDHDQGRDAVDVAPMPGNIIIRTPVPAALQTWNVYRTALWQHNFRTEVHVLLAQGTVETGNNGSHRSYAPWRQYAHLWWNLPSPAEALRDCTYTVETTGGVDYHVFTTPQAAIVDLWQLDQTYTMTYDANDGDGDQEYTHTFDYSICSQAVVSNYALRFVIGARYAGNEPDALDPVVVYYDSAEQTQFPDNGTMIGWVQTSLGWFVDCGSTGYLDTAADFSARVDVYDAASEADVNNPMELTNFHHVTGNFVSAWSRTSQLYQVFQLVASTGGNPYEWSGAGGWACLHTLNDDQSFAQLSLRATAA